MRLTEQQKSEVRAFLISQKLLFRPLQDEMLDHISSDLEERMSSGESFDDAWLALKSEIPESHFLTLQKETMESINKRITLTQWLSIVALAALLLSTLFKVLHLQFAGALLLLSFSLMAGSLLVSSLTGFFLNKDKRGAVNLLMIVVGLLLVLAGYGFKVMHWPGADLLIVMAVTLVAVSLVMNTLYMYHGASNGNSLLAYLHERHTPGIERFLLFLLIPLCLYKIWIIIKGGTDLIVHIALLVVIFGAALQFVAITWRAFSNSLHMRNLVSLVFVLIAIVCMSLPFLGPLIPANLRIIAIVLFSLVSFGIASLLSEEKSVVSLAIACLLPIVFVGWGLIRVEAIPFSYHEVIFNLPILFAFVIGLFISKKHSLMRTYFILTIGSYLLEYIM